MLDWALKCCIIEELQNPHNCSHPTSCRASFAQIFVIRERQGQSRYPKVLVAYIERKGPFEELSHGRSQIMPYTLLLLASLLAVLLSARDVCVRIAKEMGFSQPSH